MADTTDEILEEESTTTDLEFWKNYSEEEENTPLNKTNLNKVNKYIENLQDSFNTFSTKLLGVLNQNFSMTGDNNNSPLSFSIDVGNEDEEKIITQSGFEVTSDDSTTYTTLSDLETIKQQTGLSDGSTTTTLSDNVKENKTNIENNTTIENNLISYLGQTITKDGISQYISGSITTAKITDCIWTRIGNMVQCRLTVTYDAEIKVANKKTQGKVFDNTKLQINNVNILPTPIMWMYSTYYDNVYILKIVDDVPCLYFNQTQDIAQGKVMYLNFVYMTNDTWDEDVKIANNYFVKASSTTKTGSYQTHTVKYYATSKSSKPTTLKNQSLWAPYLTYYTKQDQNQYYIYITDCGITRGTTNKKYTMKAINSSGLIASTIGITVGGGKDDSLTTDDLVPNSSMGTDTIIDVDKYNTIFTYEGLSDADKKAIGGIIVSTITTTTSSGEKTTTYTVHYAVSPDEDYTTWGSLSENSYLKLYLQYVDGGTFITNSAASDWTLTNLKTVLGIDPTQNGNMNAGSAQTTKDKLWITKTPSYKIQTFELPTLTYTSKMGKNEKIDKKKSTFSDVKTAVANQIKENSSISGYSTNSSSIVLSIPKLTTKQTIQIDFSTTVSKYFMDRIGGIYGKLSASDQSTYRKFSGNYKKSLVINRTILAKDDNDFTSEDVFLELDEIKSYVPSTQDEESENNYYWGDFVYDSTGATIDISKYVDLTPVKTNGTVEESWSDDQKQFREGLYNIYEVDNYPYIAIGVKSITSDSSSGYVTVAISTEKITSIPTSSTDNIIILGRGFTYAGLKATWGIVIRDEDKTADGVFRCFQFLKEDSE